jgi:hypothetical protein
VGVGNDDTVGTDEKAATVAAAIFDGDDGGAGFLIDSRSGLLLREEGWNVFHQEVSRLNE